LLEKINGLFLVSSVNPPIDAKILWETNKWDVGIESISVTMRIN
jgi:hypothetical protein